MRCLTLLLLLPVLSCSSNITRLGDENADQLLHFVHDGVATEQELIGRLGQPHARFEGSRILTYLLNDTNGGLNVTNEPEEAQYHLVLVFEQNSMLRQHSLVRVR